MDWNNDGKKDLLIGEANDAYIRIYLNEGTDANPVFNSYTRLQVAGQDFTAVYRAAPEVVDWNNDGKKDVLCGNAYGNIFLLINTGTDANPSFNTAIYIQDGTSNLNVGALACPVVVDWNGDGKKDLLVGTGNGNIYYFENKGTDANPVFNGSVKLSAGGSVISFSGYPRPMVADLNGDGRLDLLVGTTKGNVIYYQGLNPAYPDFNIVDYLVNDSSGNTNGVLNPGETAQITVRLINGAGAAQNVNATLSCASPYITVTSSNSSFGNMNGGQTAMNSMLPFAVSVAGNAPQDSFYTFNLNVWAPGCPTTNSLAFTVGGYSCMTSVPFSWIDASAGTQLVFEGRAAVAPVNIGFPFPFYGRNWTQLYVSSQGYITFGYGDRDWHADTLIGPYWYGLVGTGAGTGTVTCAGGGAAPNRYLIVEWNGVTMLYMGGNLTFEAILYEDGRIRFQYGPMSGWNSDGSWTTVGIENYDGTTNIWYDYDQSGSIYPGLAVEFNMSRPPCADSAGDGLPDVFKQFYFAGADATGNQDSDGDGVSNWKEILAGTDPADARSVLALEYIGMPTATNVAFTWQSVPGKSYHIQGATNLLSGGWTNVNVSPISGNATGMNCFTGTAQNAGSVFYRVVVP